MDVARKTRIVLVDDHSVLRDGLRRILELEPDLEIVGEAVTGEAALELLEKVDADVVLMDVRMPGMGGIEATRRLRLSRHDVQVLVLSAYPEFAPEALHAGAAGYVLKSAATRQLVASIRAVACGSMAIQRDLPGVLPWTRRDGAHGNGTLSEREHDVLRLVVRGLTNRAIAHELGISPRTADQHVHNMLVKIGAATRAQAVRYAIEHELSTVSI
jgi:DNA-binding NarL/FixJ family response regulator